MLVLLGSVIAILAIAMLGAGLLALVRNPKNSKNRWFFIFSALLSVWIPANFIDSNTASSISAFFLKIDFGTGIFIVWSYLLFVNSLGSKTPNKNHFGRLLKVSAFCLSALLSALSFTGLLFSSRKGNNHLNITYFSDFYFYAAVTIFYFLLAFSLLYIKRKHTSREDRESIDLMFAGTFLGAVANILTNLIFPLTIHSHLLVKELNIVGYIGLVAMGLSIYVSITTKKLFDIKLVAVRSVAYILSLLTIGSLFAFGTFALISVIFKNSQLNSVDTRIIYTVLAILLSAIFPTLKAKFDKLTTHFFYQDAYDPSSFIEKLNRLLVSNYELIPLLRKVSFMIEETLKSNYVLFVVKNNDREWTVGNLKHSKTKVEIDAFIASLKLSRKKIIYADLLDDRSMDLKQSLYKNNVAIVARLTTSAREAGIGYIILGPKRSGSAYSSQDLKILEIIANELVLAIQNAMHTEEIESFNNMLQERINSATRKLRSTNEKLRALDEAKDDFVSMASHQLRTPLTSVKGNISLVLDGDAGEISDVQRQLLEQAFISSQRMVFLIADLLNVSRLKTGKFIIEPTQVNLADIIEEEVSQLVDTAKSRNLTLTYVKPEGITELMLDETKTRQVIMNFIDNAIYYTPSGGKIDVILKETNSAIEFKVVDNGIGVPKAERHHLFTKFYRAANARKARPDGTGLGLFMAKKVIVSEGGAIIFDTEEGKGSTFGFSFPKATLSTGNFLTPKDQTVAVADR